jgi:RNA polymerase sigma-70 factor (ECF subfamily)
VDQNDGNLIGPVGPELLGRLLNERAAALELYARQFCDCPEDIVQESLIDLARQVVLPVDTVAWLYRVVRNKAISASRAGNRRKKHELDAVAGRQNWFSTTPGDAIDAEKAKAVLTHLDRDEREIVVARIWGGLTFQQIAELIGATDSTAFRRYESALQKIRRKLRVPCPKTTN